MCIAGRSCCSWNVQPWFRLLDPGKWQTCTPEHIIIVKCFAIHSCNNSHGLHIATGKPGFIQVIYLSLSSANFLSLRKKYTFRHQANEKQSNRPGPGSLSDCDKLLVHFLAGWACRCETAALKTHFKLAHSTIQNVLSSWAGLTYICHWQPARETVDSMHPRSTLQTQSITRCAGLICKQFTHEPTNDLLQSSWL